MGLQVFRVEDEVSSSKILEIACGELSIEVVQGRSSSSRRRREVLRPHLANVKQTVPNSIRAIFRLHVIKTEHALHEPTVLRQITHMIGYQAPGNQGLHRADSRRVWSCSHSAWAMQIRSIPS